MLSVAEARRPWFLMSALVLARFVRTGGGCLGREELVPCRCELEKLWGVDLGCCDWVDEGRFLLDCWGTGGGCMDA